MSSLRLNMSSPTSDVRSSAGRLFHDGKTVGTINIGIILGLLQKFSGRCLMRSITFSSLSRTKTSQDARTDAGTVSRAERDVGTGLRQTPTHAHRRARSNKSSRDAGPVQWAVAQLREWYVKGAGDIHATPCYKFGTSLFIDQTQRLLKSGRVWMDAVNDDNFLYVMV